MTVFNTQCPPSTSLCLGQATDPQQESVGGHTKDPLATVLGEEGPGNGCVVAFGVADGGVGENQCHHSPGGPRDHGPADRSVTPPPQHPVTTQPATPEPRTHDPSPQRFLAPPIPTPLRNVPEAPQQTNKRHHKHPVPCSIPQFQRRREAECGREAEVGKGHSEGKRSIEMSVGERTACLRVSFRLTSPQLIKKKTLIHFLYVHSGTRKTSSAAMCAPYSHVINCIAKVIM